MVNVVFIVEGKVEQIFIDFLHKSQWFSQKNINKIGPTIDVKGGGNLCPKNMQTFVEQALTYNPDKIFILTDLECDPCIEKTKERLGICDLCITVIARKAIEAWFLADDNVLSLLTNGLVQNFEYPEITDQMPYDTYKSLLLEHTGRGTGSKVTFTRKILKSGFDIERAANHQNCTSARYFIDKIITTGAQ